MHKRRVRRENIMKRSAKNKRNRFRIALAGVALILSFTAIRRISEQKTEADAALAGTTGGEVSITGEQTSARAKFTKQFTMSDGSFTAAVYSMPVHYKTSSGKWKEIDTTLVTSGSGNLKNSPGPAEYRTKATDLKIRVAKKANKKSVVSMKRGKSSLSIALKDTEILQSKDHQSQKENKDGCAEPEQGNL